MLDLLTAAPREVRFGEMTLRVGALKLREWGLLQRWIRDHAPRPTERARTDLEYLGDAVTPEERGQILKDAVAAERENWPPAVETREGNRILLDDPDGRAYFLAVMLRKYQPEMADEELERIAAGLSPEDFGVLVQVAFGSDDLDPEAARAAARERLRGIREQLAAHLEAPTTDSSSTPSSPDSPGPGPGSSPS